MIGMMGFDVLLNHQGRHKALPLRFASRKVLCISLALDVRGGIQRGLVMPVRFGGDYAIRCGFRLSSE